MLYITGESGSGKSVILNEIAEESKVEIPYDKYLYEWDEDKNKALHVLSLVGLGDAVLFVSKYNQLSDSQKARARIALLLLNDEELIVIDEFLSTLDRKTAKAVAFCIQKALRKMNKKAILVTAHDDLEDYLMPTYVIKGKAFPSEFKVYSNNYNKNIIMDNIEFKYGDKTEYKNNKLGELHYKGKYTGGTKEYLYAYMDNALIGVLVSTYRMHDGGRRISRVVIHPSYRGCGVGVNLISRYINDYNGADTVASMAMFNPVFEKAGMTRVDDTIIKIPPKLKKKLKELDFDFNSMYSKTYCMNFGIKEESMFIFDEIIKSIGYLICPGGKYLTEEELLYKIHNEPKTRGRVLWNLRERRMAKFIS